MPCIALLMLLAACASRPDLQRWPPLHDIALQAHVQDLVCRMIAGPCAAFPVLLVDRHETQAEVLPDGRVAVRLGLLLAIEEEAELVFVLAHEIAHRQLGHRAPRTEAARLPLELEADAAAVVALRRLGYPEDAGYRLITRLTRAAESEDEQDQRGHVARMQIESRLAALPPDTGRVARQDLEWQALLAPYRR